MRKQDLDAIATREAHCKPYGSAVTLSIGEREELVALARRYLALREADPDEGMPVPMVHECSAWGRWYWSPRLGESLDKELDAAMAKEN